VDWVRIFDSAITMQNRLVENKPQLLLVRDKRICLVLRDKQLLAVQDSCTHNGESLSKGSINFLGEITCPWHGYQFNLKTGRECSERSHDLITYPVKEEPDGIFIGL
jgi:nitrite reductase/ring-hydroxylating ferredoxin subunit